MSPQDILNKILFVLNWLNPKQDTQTPPAITHGQGNTQDFSTTKVLAKVYVPESDNWVGPEQLITWGRGYACVSTGDKCWWIPAKWVKPWLDGPRETEPEDSNFDVLLT